MSVTWGTATRIRQTADEAGERQVFPRCDGCGHEFHGLPCRRSSCGCGSSWEDLG